MTGSRLKKAIYYQLDYFMRASLYVYGIAIVVICAIGFLITNSGNDGNVIGLGGTAFIHFLIVGLSGIRADLRFFIQHGISRRTTFLSHLFGSLICSVALGLFCEIFIIVSNHLLGASVSFSLLPSQSFFQSWATYTFAFFFAWQVGVLISLIYYRLSKIQQIVFTVTVLAVVVLAFSQALRLTGSIIIELGGFPLNPQSEGGITSLGMLILPLFGILAAIGSYLLIRRVTIKE